MASNGVEAKAKYACDACKTSKVTCSRERSGCLRCRKNDARCIYSRAGVIHRTRKRQPLGRKSSIISAVRDANTVNRGDDPVLQSLLTADIEETREQLGQVQDPERDGSLGALSSLAEACAAVSIWHQASRLDTTNKEFFLFEEHAEEWAQVFTDVLSNGASLMGPAPTDVVHHLRASRPHRVRPRAWLVMYYSVILNATTSASLKEKLQHNLRLALSDVSVLLEPSEANMHALVLVLSQASEFSGPSLSWMLATTACRMLQALGVDEDRFDPATRERRLATFWHLNLLDKGLALIFARTPTFHQETVKRIGLPTLDQIQPSRSHITRTGAPGFFAKHYMYQKILLSRLMDDIWHCLRGEAEPNADGIEAASNDLESWHEHARRILEAAAISEKPFCDAKNATSIDVALHTIDFHFWHLSILLARSSASLREKRLHASKQMLHLLQYMAPESREPYHPITWQLVCSPFTPLLILYRDIVCADSRGNREALAAMDRFPSYLKDLGTRNSLSRHLEGIARVLVQHARSVVLGRESTSTRNGPLSVRSSSHPSLEMDIHDSAMSLPGTSQLEHGGFDGDLRAFMDSFDANWEFDWLGLDSQSLYQGPMSSEEQ